MEQLGELEVAVSKDPQWARQGRPLSADDRKTIVVLKRYFDQARVDPSAADGRSVERVARALGVGEVTVERVMAEYNKDPSSVSKEQPARGRPPRLLHDSLQVATRDFVRRANGEGRQLTLEMVSRHLSNIAPDQDVSVRTLGRALDRWGFVFGKGTRSQRLKEKDHVILARRAYLRRKMANRKGSGFVRPEVYLDESYVNKNHSNDLTWYWEDDGPWVQKPTGKGERLIIVNAVTEKGWVPGAMLTFKSTKKTGDYHGQMNYGLFLKWFTERLLPNIPQKSLIIMDNAAYHNNLAPHSAPTPTSKKDEIHDWLIRNGIPVRDDCLKAELVEMLKRMAPTPTYAIDVVAEEAGHSVLRTPPYHPELQPIETCWAIVKNHVARSGDFTMAGLVKELEIGFQQVTSKTCSGLIRRLRKVEDCFWNDDAALDDAE